MHCRIFSSMPGLCPLDASNTSRVVTVKHVSSPCQMSPGGQNCPIWRTIALDTTSGESRLKVPRGDDDSPQRAGVSAGKAGRGLGIHQ